MRRLNLLCVSSHHLLDYVGTEERLGVHHMGQTVKAPPTPAQRETVLTVIRKVRSDGFRMPCPLYRPLICSPLLPAR